MERRNLTFQQLKPHCVNLSQAVLRVAGNNGNPRDVVNALARLLEALKDAQEHVGVLNDKLAEYVFFPLSYVLREKQKLPVVALELALQCLVVLLQTGWRSNIESALSHQLLLLLTVLAGGSFGNRTLSQTSEELQSAAFKCLTELFVTCSQSAASRKVLTETANIPPLGHAVTVILEGVREGSSYDVQVAAVQALSACCSAVRERDALASFLPGIVSTLAKLITPSTKQRRPYEVLRTALGVLSQLFKNVISDRATKDLPVETEPTDIQRKDSGPIQQQLTGKWLRATTAQIKLALANIIRIRQHERKEVRQALLELCLTVLEDCRESLKDSAAMMIETMIVLCGSDAEEELQSTVRHVISADQRVAELLRSSTHSWIISLPRIMQSPDDTAKRRLVHQISLGYELLADQGIGLDVVDHAMAMNLRDGISTAFLDQAKIREMVTAKELPLSLELTSATREGPSTEFRPILYENRSQQEIVHDLQDLVKHFSSSKSSLNAARELIDSLHSSKDVSQLANFWVSLQLLKCSADKDTAVDAFLDFGEPAVGPQEELLEEMYSFSLGVLQGSPLEPQVDWRLQALAMETIALQAQTLQSDFKLELIDALYPVVHLVGSPIPQLRDHAITCLNIVASACGYRDVGNLIVENVDYLVNAVALKLNTFDISPQAPQVLLMMIKLSGPVLLPYLDDLVGSIFAALESFHGYPKLVELLFSVLKGIAEEGVKTPQLAITANEEKTSHRRPPCKPTTITDIVAILKDIQSRNLRKDDEDDDQIAEAFPRRAWKEHIEKEGLKLEEDIAEEEQSEDDQAISAPEPPPPAPKTYDLLMKISQLTQHYLSSSSPTLRTSLLSLLGTTMPALARHENSFLPLINTLWPVLAPRLKDGEVYVVAGSLDIMREMCVHAGDFMRSRIEEVWPDLIHLYHNGGRSAQQHSGSGSIKTITSKLANTRIEVGGSGIMGSSMEPYYVDAPTRIIRSSLLNLYTTVIDTVSIEEEAYHEVLEMLLPVVAERREVREAFERRNPDAVWLALLRWRMEKSTAKGVDVMKDESLETPPAWEGRKFVSVLG